jgi:hypothetical protein
MCRSYWKGLVERMQWGAISVGGRVCQFEGICLRAAVPPCAAPQRAPRQGGWLGFSGESVQRERGVTGQGCRGAWV